MSNFLETTDIISNNNTMKNSRHYTYGLLIPENIELVKTMLNFGMKPNAIYNRTGISRHYIKLIKEGVQLPIQNHRPMGPKKVLTF